MDTPTEINAGKQPTRNRETIAKQILGELNETRLKEAKAKLKQLYIDLNKANEVVKAKEDEIAAVYEEYGDIIAE